MNDSKTVVEDLAAWLGRIWDEDEDHVRREGGYCVSGMRGCVREPRQVLARIAADRKILALHQPSGGDCSTCCGEPYMEEYWNRPTQTETVVWKRADLAWPCPTIRLLAEQYADRPGFRPEWSVERQGVEWT